ncbi:MAG: type II secretion system F family protein [Patescibacteria group bacterium]
MNKKFENMFLHVSLDERILFTKNLALALKSGISLVNSLKLIDRQTKSKSFKKVLASLMEDANRGVFLSDGLVKFKNIFGDLFINVIKVAETSGTLPENLIYLGNELGKKAELRKKIRGALIYPIIILIATVVIGVTMVVFVFPKILPLFENTDVVLPFTTRTLIWFSAVISSYGIWIGLGLIALFIGLRFLLKLKPIRYIYDSSLFYVPFLGKSIVNYNIANFTRTFGLLLTSGVQITEALNIAALTLTNTVYRSELEEAANGVRKGEFLSKFITTRPRHFPIIASNMIEVGENTGNLTENLKYLSEYYENEVDDFVKNLSSILEPILLLVMGGIVGFIALSFITPIYQVTQTIR